MPTGVEDILEIAAAALAQAADAVSLVTAPRALGDRVKHLDLVKLNDSQALLVLVLEGNLVRQHALSLHTPTDQSVLSAIAAVGLNPQVVVGLDATEMSFQAALEVGRHACGPRARPPQPDRRVHGGERQRQHGDTLILHDGVRNRRYHQPEFGDVDLLQQW